MSLYWLHLPPNSEKVINEVQSEETDVRSRHSRSWISLERTFFQLSTVETFWYFTLYRLWVLWKKCHKQRCGMITPGEGMRFFAWWSLLATDTVSVWLSSLPNWSFLKGPLSLYRYSIQLSAWNVVAVYQEKGSVYFVVGEKNEVLEPSIPVFKVLVLLISFCVLGKVG